MVGRRVLHILLHNLHSPQQVPENAVASFLTCEHLWEQVVYTRSERVSWLRVRQMNGSYLSSVANSMLEVLKVGRRQQTLEVSQGGFKDPLGTLAPQFRRLR